MVAVRWPTGWALLALLAKPIASAFPLSNASLIYSKTYILKKNWYGL